MPFSNLMYPSPWCSDTCHLPTTSIWYVYHFSVHQLHTSAALCTSAPCNLSSAIPCPSNTCTPTSCQVLSHTFFTLTESYTLSMLLPDALPTHHTDSPLPGITTHHTTSYNHITLPPHHVCLSVLSHSTSLKDFIPMKHLMACIHHLLHHPMLKYFSSKANNNWCLSPCLTKIPSTPQPGVSISLLLLSCFKHCPQAGASFSII